MRIFKLLWCTALLLPVFNSYSESRADKYADYCLQLQDKLGVKISIPSDRMKFINEPFTPYTFGEMREDIAGGIPTFMGGPIFMLSENCTVLMCDISSLQKPRPESYPDDFDYRISAPETGWMLNNCGTQWANWYIYDIGGVIVKVDDDNNRVDEDKTALQKQVEALRKQYERCMDKGRLVENTNCDRIYIVRIPNIDKIGVMMDVSKVPAELKENKTECYGVEFFKRSSYGGVNMLFFLNGSTTNIDECVESLAKYIRFEK